MTVVAASLVVADMRIDLELNWTWLSTDGHAILDDCPVAFAAASRGWQYDPLPHDERVRRILQAHRGDVRAPYLPAGALFVVAGTENDEPAAAVLVSVALPGQPADDAMADGAFTLRSAPKLIAENGKLPIRMKTGVGKRQSTLLGAKERLIVDAGRWQPTVPHLVQSVAPSCHSAHVIVLTDRREHYDSPAVLQPSLEFAEPPQTSCRGPPASGRRPFVPARDQVGRHIDNVVSDNFSDPVPVGVAELDVIEAFLGDVLSDVLTAASAAKVRRRA